jgi:hypothetical protein
MCSSIRHWAAAGEVDIQKLGPALLIASSLVLAVCKLSNYVAHI